MSEGDLFHNQSLAEIEKLFSAGEKWWCAGMQSRVSSGEQTRIACAARPSDYRSVSPPNTCALQVASTLALQARASRGDKNATILLPCAAQKAFVAKLFLARSIGGGRSSECGVCDFTQAFFVNADVFLTSTVSSSASSMSNSLSSFGVSSGLTSGLSRSAAPTSMNWNQIWDIESRSNQFETVL